MIQLTSLEHDLKPYGFVKLDYGRTWTNGSLAFIGESLVIISKPSTKDFETVINLHSDNLLEMSGKS